MTGCAVVAGAGGVIGRRLVEELLGRGWKVAGLTRRQNGPAGMQRVEVDLRDAAQTDVRIGELGAVTHVFYAARFDHGSDGKVEPIEANETMLRNVVLAAQRSGALRHVHAVHGTKYYGHQLGPVALPLTEDSPRAPGSNFYFGQEDFLAQASSGSSWTFSTSRPHAICDSDIQEPRSLGLVFAVFAAIQRELGEPFHFPGTARAFTARSQFTDLGLLTRAIVWMATHPDCANQAFNVVNGDNPSWVELWTPFASFFDMEVGRALGLCLVDYMAGKEELWRGIVARHGLLDTQLSQVALWKYGDVQPRPEWDVVSSMDKARRYGFEESVDSCAMFLQQFGNYRKQRVIP